MCVSIPGVNLLFALYPLREAKGGALGAECAKALYGDGLGAASIGRCRVSVLHIKWRSVQQHGQPATASQVGGMAAGGRVLFELR